MPPTKDEVFTNSTEKIPDPPINVPLPESEINTENDMEEAFPPPPSPPRTPPSPTSPTSPPSPVSPVSPTSPSSPVPFSPPNPPEPRPGEQVEQNEEEDERRKNEEEDASATLSSALMLMDVYAKTASKPVYTRYPIICIYLAFNPPFSFVIIGIGLAAFSSKKKKKKNIS